MSVDGSMAEAVPGAVQLFIVIAGLGLHPPVRDRLSTAEGAGSEPRPDQPLHI